MWTSAVSLGNYVHEFDISNQEVVLTDIVFLRTVCKNSRAFSVHIVKHICYIIWNIVSWKWFIDGMVVSYYNAKTYWNVLSVINNMVTDLLLQNMVYINSILCIAYCYIGIIVIKQWKTRIVVLGKRSIAHQAWRRKSRNENLERSTKKKCEAKSKYEQSFWTSLIDKEELMKQARRGLPYVTSVTMYINYQCWAFIVLLTREINNCVTLIGNLRYTTSICTNWIFWTYMFSKLLLYCLFHCNANCWACSYVRY